MNRSEHDLVSYRTLRRLVGWLGIAMPIVLGIGGALIVEPSTGLRTSISDYYYSPLRNVFVGFLFAVGAFMWCYEGWDWRDRLAGNVACVALIVVALCPCKETGAVAAAHYIAAGVFFADLAVFSLYLFRLKGKSPPTPQKLQRNAWYAANGTVIVLCLVGIGVTKLVVGESQLVFWLESLALVAFGWSWLLKGELVFAD